MRHRRWLAAMLVPAALLGTAVSARALERLAPAENRAEQLLYLPNGKHLRLVSLGHAPLLADLIYLWAIQYYSVLRHGGPLPLRRATSSAT